MIVLHDTFRKEEVSEEGSDQEVGTVQTREYLSRECRPCYRVRDGSEDPVELTQRCSSILEVTGNTHHHLDGQARAGVVRGPVDITFQWVLLNEEAECRLDRRSQAAGEEVGGKVRRHGEDLVREAWC